MDLVDHAASNFNVVIASGAYVFPADCADGNVCVSFTDNHSETVVES